MDHPRAEARHRLAHEGEEHVRLERALGEAEARAEPGVVLRAVARARVEVRAVATREIHAAAIVQEVLEQRGDRRGARLLVVEPGR